MINITNMESTTSQKEAFEMLKQMRVQVNQQNLCYYSGTGADVNTLQLLLRAGLNPNQAWTSEKGTVFYPLLHAVENGTVKTVAILLNNGADVNIQDAKTKETAMYLAQQLKKNEIVQLLKNFGVKELTEEEMNALKKKINGGYFKKALAYLVLFLLCWGGCTYMYNHSNSSSSSSITKTHVCTWCHKQYSGAGYYHIEDQCNTTNADYDQCCSEKCCMESWNASHH
jgi:hypothetical protein